MTIVREVNSNLWLEIITLRYLSKKNSFPLKVFYFVYNYNVHIYYTVNITQMMYIVFVEK